MTPTLPLFPGKIQRWIIETRGAGDNPTEQDVRDRVVAFINETLPRRSKLARRYDAKWAAPKNLERLNVLLVSRTPFVPGGWDGPVATLPDELAGDAPSQFVEVEVRYLGDDTAAPWPYAVAPIWADDVPSNSDTAIRAVYAPAELEEARPLDVEPPLPGFIPFPEPPDVELPELPSSEDVRAAAWTIAGVGAAVLVALALARRALRA